VFKDMKMGFLAEDTDYGTRELREIMKGLIERTLPTHVQAYP
jgi:hypothetical protein